MRSTPLPWLLLLALAAGCARIPANRYGVRSLRIRGMHAMDEDALRNCLSLSERERAGLTLGVTSAGACGEPPFDEHHARLLLWAWPWTRWPLFDRVALSQDQRRIERWYEARGFHSARVVRTVVSPARAARNDTLPRRDPTPHCTRRGAGQGCVVDVAIRVEEGPPTEVARVRVLGIAHLPRAMRRSVSRALRLHQGARFDEALYDRSKEAIVEALGEHGYARAKVTGVARVDRVLRRATVDLTVEPGPRCFFGTVRVVGADGLPIAPIRAATLLGRGNPYRASDLEDAQSAVYGLGAFSSVLVEPVLPREGNVVDVRVTVTQARRQRLGLGVGLQSGVLQAGQGQEQVSVPQWDVHLSAKYENRDFGGGLRQLLLEDRPRLIIPDSFPNVESPRLGNVVRAELRQPGFVEPRTRAVLSAGHEYGPDPFDLFFRHRVDSGASVERYFLYRQHLFLTMGIRNSLYFVGEHEQTLTGEPTPTSSVLTFYEQVARMDYRDLPQRPHRGVFLELTVHEAGYGLPSSWRYVRLLPDARFYVPLPWRITLAGRFALGMMLIERADPDLDPLSETLGPRDFRLRGGGATSNRGFLPGSLGDGPEGGLRRWEASLELRIPVTGSFGAVLFADAGDVSRLPTFRFDLPQISLGFGLRYFTLVGALRLDVGWRVPGLQVLGDEDRRNPGARETDVDVGLFEFPGAVHLTLGEAF